MRIRWYCKLEPMIWNLTNPLILLILYEDLAVFFIWPCKVKPKTVFFEYNNKLEHARLFAYCVMGGLA